MDDRRLTRTLQRWFEHNAADLPWRRRRTAYRALVAEAMLQQTQVTRVAERFPAFLRQFPSLRALAEADEQAVLAAWQGLGYYRRARHLHQAAKVIRTRHAGRVPQSAEALRQLPGVGRYTAGAIASIVFGRAEPIVDGNVRRLLLRWHEGIAPPESAARAAWCWRRAGELVHVAADPGLFNEAMMELGRVICAPRSPRCDACPLRRQCVTGRNGRTAQSKPSAGSSTRPVLHHHAVIIRRGDRILLEQRPTGGMWPGMWQTPTVESSRPLAAEEVACELPIRVSDMRFLRRFEHSTTHRRVTFHVFEARTRVRRGTWRDPDNTDDLPMGNAQRKALSLI